MAPLNILHVFRAPVGGLFRHVLDLAASRPRAATASALIADSNTGGERAETAFAELAPQLALGLTRIPMRRHIGPGDLLARCACHAPQSRRRNADVVHGHGAKGGAYARLALNARRACAPTRRMAAACCSATTPLAGKFYLATENLLMLRGDLFLFESAYQRRRFSAARSATPRGLVRVVHNGVSRKEFEPVIARAGRHAIWCSWANSGRSKASTS